MVERPETYSTWPCEYRRDTYLSMRADHYRQKGVDESARVYRTEDYNLTRTWRLVLIQPQLQDMLGRSSQLENIFIAQEVETIYCFTTQLAPLGGWLPEQVWTSQTPTGELFRYTKSTLPTLLFIHPVLNESSKRVLGIRIGAQLTTALGFSICSSQKYVSRVKVR